jgi:4-amino-4-deoxy-L-arabinose transferase-like glycosyltransferase
LNQPEERAVLPGRPASFIPRVDVPLVLILLLGTVLRLQYLDLPLADAHRWRQTFNADVARQFVKGPFDIFHPRVNWGGPDGVVAMEFPLFPAIIASVIAVTGEHPGAERAVTIAFSFGTILLLYLLGRDLAGRGAGRGAAFLFAISPSAVYFGRAVMVDVPMLFFSVGAVLGYLRYLERGTRAALVAGAVSLALAGLVKLPNILVLGPIVYLGWALRSFAILKDRRFVLSLVVAVASIAAWYWHADVIFHRTGLGVASFHPAGTYGPEVSIAAGPMSLVTSWSTVDRLSDPEFYSVILDRLWHLHLTAVGFALALVGIPLAATSRRHSMLIVWLAAAISFVLATAEGNFWHDYHQMPLLPPAMLLAGLAAGPAFDVMRGSPWFHDRSGIHARVTAIGLGLAIGASGLLAFQKSNVIDSHFRPHGLDRDRMNAGAAIAAATPEDALVAVVEYLHYGNNSPTLLYYANRRGWSLDLDSVTDHALVQLRRNGARYFATTHWPELQAERPEVAEFLRAHGPLPLEGAPRGTALFRLR